MLCVKKTGLHLLSNMLLLLGTGNLLSLDVDMGNSKKVLLIGWDAADWKVIHKLMDDGRMPTLQRLVENGTMGNMTTLFPALSPMLWTSIATGKRPYKHGIYGFTEPTPDKSNVQPMTSISRKSKAIWNILNQRGMKSVVVGWWPSHPAEPIDGVMISDFFHKAPRKPGDPWSLMKNCVHPASMQEALAGLRLHPEQLQGEHILPFVPNASKVDQDVDQRLSMLMRTICECVTVHRTATTLLTTQDWDFAAVYYDAIDHFCHGFMKYHPPKQKMVRDEDFEIYNNVINYAYIYHDEILKRLIETAGEDTTIILMSDHGFHPDHLRPKMIPTEPAGPAVEHRDLGIFVASGPNIKKDHVVGGANLLDITPTILTIYDLPIGQDMDGQPLLDIFDSAPDPQTIPSWEDIPGATGQHLDGANMGAAESKETMEQLIALGYIDRPDKDTSVAVENCQRELDYNLARAFMDGSRFGDAIPLLNKLYNRYPLEFRFGLQLSNCLQAMDRKAELELLIDDLNGRWRNAQEVAKKKITELAKISKERRLQFKELQKIDEENEAEGNEAPKLARRDAHGKPILFNQVENNAIRKIRAVGRGNPQVLDFLSASIAASKGDFDQAISHMEAAETSTSRNPMFHNQLGNFYLALKRHDDAERSFTKALEIDDLNANSLLGMCRCSLQQGKAKKAIDFGKQAIGVKFHLPIGHFYLGQAFSKAGKYEDAVSCFHKALKQNPNFVEAHEKLEKIYTKQIPNADLALEHRAAKAELQTGQAEYLEETEAIEINPVESDEFETLLPKLETDELTEFIRCLGQPKQINVSEDKEKDAITEEPKQEIVVVTGLPRSGTSMMMQMLVAGGMNPFVDQARQPDESNPKGYFESERVKKLPYQNNWLSECEGHVVKVVAPLVPYLPQGLNYRIIFMNRDLEEIVESQRTMLEKLNRDGGDLTPERFRELFAGQTRAVGQLLTLNQIPCCEIKHRETISNPSKVAAEVQSFLGLDLSLEKMTAAVDPSLYRQKHQKGDLGSDA